MAKRISLRQQLLSKIPKGKNTNNNTSKTYRNSAKQFAEWGRANHIKNIENIDKEVIQAYSSYLGDRGYSAATIHTKLAPICKIAEINMAQIVKPSRSCGDIIRGRDEYANSQGRYQADSERFKRVVDLQRAVGVRRSELAKLKPSDVIITKYGSMWVHVAQGKGGKEQYQYILPQDVDKVKEIIDGIVPGDTILSKEEMNNKINLHGIRAEHARKVYYHFKEKCDTDPKYRENLKESLKMYYKNMNDMHVPKNIERYNTFCKDMRDGSYIIRGENKEKAFAQGLPIEYDRLCLMATSVYSLSHWRLDVTVCNYMIY